MSGLQVAVLVVAVAFLAGAVAFVLGENRGGADPLNAVDVGFLQDMSLHHDQAVEMSLMLAGKDDVDPALAAFANEILVDQRYQQGIFSATLDRFGHSPDPGDEVMGWMGSPMPASEMTGLATPAQLAALREAEGEEAAALWIALMSEHHLAGLHMADHAARHGSDATTVNVAEGIVKTQRGEILDLARYRERVGLPIPEGFDDPTTDPLMATQTARDQAGD
jgi:uncharacterized protein (DUF305 family)